MRSSAVFLVLAACATTPKSEARNSTCEIDVELVTAPFVGRASTPNDARKTLADARKAACAVLHESSPGTDCDDPSQVIESIRTLTQGAEVSLRRVVSLLHERAEGSVRDPLALCRSATAKLCASPPEGLSCYQAGVVCEPIDEISTRCAPVERARARPLR